MPPDEEPTISPDVTLGPERSIGGDVTAGADVALGVIDRYVLVAKLGQGGFGAVYRARDTIAGVDVALKSLPPLVAHNPDEFEQVRANFQLVEKLSHTHIAGLRVLHRIEQMDAAADQLLGLMAGDYLVVMEYVPGVTLRKWWRQFEDGQVPVEQALAVCGQIAEALDYAHSKRVVHRDIKPGNIMVATAADGRIECKVLDFGLAAEIRSSLSRVSREVGDTSGTRPYMAPEQWAGKSQGPATDQYALAVLFHELVSGAVPFASAFETNDPMIMGNVVRVEGVSALATLRSSQNRALQRGLAKAPEECCDSCRSLVGALSAGAGTGSGGFRRLAGFAAAVLLVWGAWFVLPRSEKETVAAAAPRPPMPAAV